MLAPLAVIYGGITRTRLAMYRRGFLKTSKLNAPVISIGNLTAGGTGKTPLVEYVARSVAATGRKVCILTRGYGRKNSNHRVVVSKGNQILAGEQEAGDEPFLLAEKLIGIAAVISDVDRLAAGQWAIANLNSNVFILDDGFQHLQLARDLNILVVDGSNPWGNRQLLPRGLLREPLREIARADSVVITRSDQTEDLKAIDREVTSFNRNSPLFISRMHTVGFTPLGISNSAGEPPVPVAAFCGIGNGESFILQLRKAGHEPLSVSQFPDHHRYDQADIDRVVNKARSAGARSLITTAKDAVKLKTLSIALPCWILEIEIEVENSSQFEEMIRAAVNA